MLSKSASLNCVVLFALLCAASAQDCSSLHPKVGSTGELVTVSHEVSGTITVLDDCSFSAELTYDGEGPDVFWYGADTEENLGMGVRMDGIEGEHIAKTVMVTLPEGITWDDINVLSVWCREFGVNFGSAELIAPEIVSDELDTDMDLIEAPETE